MKQAEPWVVLFHSLSGAIMILWAIIPMIVCMPWYGVSMLTAIVMWIRISYLLWKMNLFVERLIAT